MDITATIITVSDCKGNYREIAYRGDLQPHSRPLRWLQRFLKERGLIIADLCGYQQETFADSLRYHRNDY